MKAYIAICAALLSAASVGEVKFTALNVRGVDLVTGVTHPEFRTATNDLWQAVDGKVSYDHFSDEVSVVVTNNVKSTDFGPWLTGHTYSSNSSFLTLDSVRWNGEYWEVHIVGAYQNEDINGWYPASQTDETPTETYTTTNKNANATVLSSLKPPFDQQVCQALTTRRSMGGDYNALGLAYLRNISPTDTIFSNAVLAVGLGVDTNTVAQINEILVEAGESSIGPISSVGGLIVAVVVVIAWLKRKKLDLSAVGSEWVESATYGLGDNVVYDGKFYVSKAASNQGHKPTDTIWWDVSSLFSSENTSLNAAVAAKVASICNGLDPATSSIADIINALKGN